MKEFEKQFDVECEFEPLVSAFMDNELSGEAVTDVIAHLATCETCQDLHGSFREVDSLVHFSDERMSRLRSDRISSRSVRKDVAQLTIVGRFVRLAVVATLLIGLGMVLIQDRPAEADAISPEQVAQPMQQLHLINQQQRRDQELMLRVLGMDLRALKLEISQLPKDSKERSNLTQQVDLMLERIRQFEFGASGSQE